MNAKHDFPPLDAARMVYVRPVAVIDLPEDVQQMAEGLETLYALHSTDGERLALVRDRGLAFALALQNDLAPVNVH
ncbi:MAG: DUF1150 family protein [Cereibacter changlensis]|jgi:hypothetical protein|uniref:DUF1150 domain-containing protein n=2 Tax=Cereibacter changlensis TaxID=402884 RepID=A0A2T4JPJ4_9RHOB|nr:DUF1150 family protein [Cereibacter changlensis]MBZ4690639.1 hypothetical protein [Cereibacter sp.]PTE19839.1 DUF1150 domain-containing protein [Cereibacter changlensis JA139]PZX52348.1 hypothetical protein LX76_02877 [Cereibacter changlensis]TKA95526.1 DUF1150 family protein [Cereibacter changlensis]